MRPSRIVLSLALCLAIAGCTSSTAIDELQPPSQEMTSSIVRPSAAIAEFGDETQPLSPRAAAAAEPAMDAVEPAALIAAPAPMGRPMLAAQAVRPLTPQGQEIFRRKFRDAKPINFGRASPRGLAVHGVDVSRWQGNIDWDRLRAQGANFVYIKATDGGDHVDPMFRKNWRGARAAGLRHGAYHFFYWCRTAGEQADWFIRNVPREAGALPPVIDVEWNGESRCRKRPSRARVLEKMQVFMDRLEAHYGQRPIIYTAPDFYRDNLQGAFPNHPFWLRAVAQHPGKVYPGRKWLFWQYSGSGLSHGVRGRIDLNAFHGSEAEWRGWLGRVTG